MTQTNIIPFKVDIRSVTCRSCNLPHTVNKDGLCAFCARPAATFPIAGITREQEIALAAGGGVLMAIAVLVWALWAAGVVGGGK